MGSLHIKGPRSREQSRTRLETNARNGNPRVVSRVTVNIGLRSAQCITGLQPLFGLKGNLKAKVMVMRGTIGRTTRCHTSVGEAP